MFFHKYRLNFLQILLITLILLPIIFGIIMLYFSGGDNGHMLALKQTIVFAMGTIISLCIFALNPKFIENNAYILYFLALVLLICVELFGIKMMGGKRWLGVGAFRFQPCEITKISLIIGIAKFCSAIQYNKIRSMSYVIILALMILAPTILVIKQPDLGTGMILLLLGGCMLFVAGVKIWKFITVLVICSVAAPIIWHHLHPYQQKRIIIFLNPQIDPLGNGYNIIQSKIAVGSGGLFGKGIGNGTQSHLDFLPEHQTDFMFATLAEEIGLIGVYILMLMYCGIIFISTIMSFRVRSKFAQLMIVGVNMLFFCHVSLNIAMVIELAPVVGIPLPFISYGGANLISMMIGFALVVNAYSHRKTP